MTTHEADGIIRWECDTCGTAMETKHDFMTGWRALKALGWAAQKDGGEWWHWCKACRTVNVEELMNRPVGGRSHG
jgi:hypothetical protein